MRAATFHGRSDIRIGDVPDPAPPGPGEVALRVRRAAICGTDANEWHHGPVLARPPVILGHEFTGEIAAVGEGSGRFVVGQRVVTGAGVWCGRCEWCARGRTNLCSEYRTLGLQLDGGLAGYVLVPVRTLVEVPPGVGDDAAALAQPVAVALHALRRAGASAGQSCVVIGVGGIGAFIVAGAARLGLSSLIAIDVDAGRLSTATALGATETINVADTDPGDAIAAATGGTGPDLIIEASGAPHAPAVALRAVKRGGRVVLVGIQGAPRELDLVQPILREVDLVTTVAHVCGQDLPEAVALLASAKLESLTVSTTIALDALVDDGIRPLVDRTAGGKILVDPWR